MINACYYCSYVCIYLFSEHYTQNPGPPSSAPPRVGGGGGSVGEITIEWDVRFTLFYTFSVSL